MLAQAPEPGFAGSWQASLGAVAGQQDRERVRRDPDARLARVDVEEQTQDARAVGGPRRKGIDVQQVVACLETELARGFFLRSQADAVELPAEGVLRQVRTQPARGRSGEAGENLTQPVRLVNGAFQV